MTKKYNEKLTFEVVKKRFDEQGRLDIELCEDGFVGWKHKCKFYDAIQGEFFFAVPKSVFSQMSCHPKRAIDNRSKTNIEKYGNVCSLHGEQTKKKVKKTNLKKYGVEQIFQSETVKDKIKETLIRKYGVDNISKLKETKVIKREKISDRFIIDTGEHLQDWIRKQDTGAPSYTSLITNFKGKDISSNDLAVFFENWKSNKTKLEVFSETLFEIPHYNKKPECLSRALRPDFKLSESIYVNVDGLYWHSEKQKDKSYHFKARKEFEDKGIRLFQFYEDEVYNKAQIVKSIVNNALGKTVNKTQARKTSIKPVEQSIANEFLYNNHLMGAIKAKHIGLYDLKTNVLVCLMSYKKKGQILNVERFCTKTNLTVVGGFSKLLKHIERSYPTGSITEVHNWVDLRYGTGLHLPSKGFKLIKDTAGWQWTDGENRYNRLKCRANMDDRQLSEKQHAEELCWYRLYDAGQRLFVKQPIY